MPIYAKNQGATIYVIPHLSGPVTLQPKGQVGSVSDVTAELQAALSDSQFNDLQVDQVAGLVYYSITTETVPPDTKALQLNSSQNIVDDSKMPRAAQAVPASAIYFDTQGQSRKSFVIKDNGGAFELEFWGSIDVFNSDPVDKEYVFVGKMAAADPGIFHVPDDILTGLSRFRFIKIDSIRGVPPQVNFQSSF